MSDDASLLGPTRALRGTPFTSERARRGYRLNKFLISLRAASRREAFLADPEADMLRHGLNDQERDLLTRRDFAALLDYGACTLALAAYTRTLGFNLVSLGAWWRGQTEEEFLAHKRAESKGRPWQY